MSHSHTRVNRTDRLDDQLLSAARAEVAPEDVRARVSAQLGLVAGASLLAGGTAAGATGKAAVGAAKLGGVWGLSSSGLAVVKVLSVVVGVAFVGGGAALVQRARHGGAPSSLAAPAAIAGHSGAAPAPAWAQSALEARVMPAARAPLAAPRDAELKAPTMLPASARATSSIGEELAALDTAHALLQGGRAQESLRVVSRYISKFPRGSMLPEAQLLEIDALKASGDAAAAARKTALFLRAHPDSPGAQRLQSDQTR